MSRLTKKDISGNYDLTYENGDFVRGIMPNEKILGEIYINGMNKLGELEDLEDELGCPLEVVFKAFKEGFYFISELFCKNVFTKQFIDRVLLYYSYELNCYCFSIGYRDDRICLKDYKKIWWLKEDLSE